MGFDAPVTTATAPQVLAYGSALSLLASIVAMLPLKVYVNGPDGVRPAAIPGVLDDPNGDGHGLQDWLYQVVWNAGVTGNAVCVVRSRDGSGMPVVLEHVNLDRVSVRRLADGRNQWRVGDDVVAAENIKHYRRYPRPQQVFGQSPVAQYAATLGLALSSERFGAQWFRDGGHPSAVLESDQPISKDTADTIKARFLAAMRGRREPFVAGAGLKFKPIQLAPEESQFLQTQQFSSAQCARILGPGLAEILGYPTGDSMTYSTREQAALDLLTYTVDPWLTGLEGAISRWLGGTRWVQFQRGALLRVDLKTRYEAHRISLGTAEPFATVNEVRALEDWQPVEWGATKPYVQGDPAAAEGNTRP